MDESIMKELITLLEKQRTAEWLYVANSGFTTEYWITPPMSVSNETEALINEFEPKEFKLDAFGGYFITKFGRVYPDRTLVKAANDGGVHKYYLIVRGPSTEFISIAQKNGQWENVSRYGQNFASALENL